MDDLIRRAEEGTKVPKGRNSRLKSKILTNLVRLAQAEGPLRSLPDSAAAGEQLCIFELGLSTMPSEALRTMNPCETCHARIAAERIENAPIYWPGCAYAKFCGH